MQSGKRRDLTESQYSHFYSSRVMANICSTCKRSRNCINGTYCFMRRAYVDRHNLTECEEYQPRQ